MSFTTYENRANPYVSIHRDNCNHLRKHGGEHAYNQGKYEEHQTYNDALKYAKGTKLLLKICSSCKPDN